MDVRHEIIQFDHESPVKLFMHKLGDVSRHWHESIELLFVLVGKVEILAGDTKSGLHQGDVLLINGNTAHELHARECVMIAVQIKLSKFALPEAMDKELYFDCNSTVSASPKDFLRLKQIIASMIKASAVRDDASTLYLRSMAYMLLSELVQNFKVSKPTRDINTQKHLDRLTSIIRYINDHYQEPLTLGQLAKREHLSSPYLSSFFEKHVGVNFSTYYTGLRLEHAVRELLYTDAPIEQIALSSGFSDTRAFVRAFKKKYNILPSLYRKSGDVQALRPDSPSSISYLDFKPENYLHILSQYLTEDSLLSRSQRGAARQLAAGAVDCTVPRQPLCHKWRTFAGVGRARELLLEDVRGMLRQLQRDIGFRYLRFHGIFSDDMMVCRREKDGGLRFSFTLVDQALDFLLSIGLKPLIQFSFMPAALAREPGHAIYSGLFIISPPGRMEEWVQLVRAFLGHIRGRYGPAEMRSWLYSVWNEPDTSQNMFGFASQEEFFALYEATFRTVKGFDPALVFGSPSLFPLAGEPLRWFKQYLDFCTEHSCRPEFIDIHYYADDFESCQHAAFACAYSISGDPDRFGRFISTIRSFLRKEKASLPLYITEWNLTVSHRNLINDTCFKACYLVKNFLENYDRTDAIGYWSLTDHIEELQPEEPLFHGGMGLFTQNGIKKPPYYAMEMLRQLGDVLLAANEGYFITRKGEAVSMILYNYEHCDPMFTQEGFGLTVTGRDGVFPLRNTMDFSVTLSGLPAPSYRVREVILNQAHGSAFDLWVAMGAAQLGLADMDALRRKSEPAIHIRQADTVQNALAYAASLAPQEVRLVQFTPVEDGYYFC